MDMLDTFTSSLISYVSYYSTRTAMAMGNVQGTLFAAPALALVVMWCSAAKEQ